MSDNEPSGTYAYRNNPQSPDYDDGGEEAWKETRYMELIESEPLEDLPGLDADKLLEIVEEYYNAPHCDNRSIMVANIVEHVEAVAVAQSDKDFIKIKDGCFEEPDNEGPPGNEPGPACWD